MSVMMTMRVDGDTDRFREFVATRGDDLRRISDDAKAKGCLHHRFAIGDGFVMVLDEWESVDAFNDFFEGNEAVAEVMRESGARSEPEITFAESIDSPDAF